MIQTNDGGYIIAGKTKSFGFKNTMTWIIKTDSEGVEEWNKTYGGKNSDSANYILQTFDGGFLILGRTESFGSGKRDIWLLKINSNGNEEWNMTFGGEKDDEGYSILNTLDYGYIIAGSTYSDDLETSDAWLIKLKPDNLPPTPAFSITPSSGDFSTTFTFDASSSTDDKDNPSDLHVRWDFDNDGIYDTEFSNVKTATHKYSKGGLKTIKLEIKDSENFANHLIKSFYVNIPPNATIINISQSIALKGQEISFRGAGTDEGKVLKYLWKSSIDGEIHNSTEANFSTSNLSKGKHTITLKIQDNNGSWSKEVSENITIKSDNGNANVIENNFMFIGLGIGFVILLIGIVVGIKKRSEKQIPQQNYSTFQQPQFQPNQQIQMQSPQNQQSQFQPQQQQQFQTKPNQQIPVQPQKFQSQVTQQNINFQPQQFQKPQFQICPFCKAQVSLEYKFCNMCGKQIRN